MPLFSLPAETTTMLERMVDRIEADPGKVIDPAIYDGEVEDVRACLKTLPEDMSEEDFYSFTFGNAADLWTATNPDFFKGTVVEKEVAAHLAKNSKKIAA